MYLPNPDNSAANCIDFSRRLPEHVLQHGRLVGRRTLGDVLGRGYGVLEGQRYPMSVRHYPDVAGDCEDLVLQKRRLLVQAGWPISSLLITVARQANGDGHAVLTVLTDRGDVILASTASKPTRTPSG